LGPDLRSPLHNFTEKSTPDSVSGVIVRGKGRVGRVDLVALSYYLSTARELSNSGQDPPLLSYLLLAVSATFVQFLAQSVDIFSTFNKMDLKTKMKKSDQQTLLSLEFKQQNSSLGLGNLWKIDGKVAILFMTMAHLSTCFLFFCMRVYLR